MPSRFVYHGSPTKCFDVAIPKRNIRSNGKDTTFDEVSFHASPHIWIALAYTFHDHPTSSMGVNLFSDEREILICGENSLEDSLKRLYGRGGYLYVFKREDFMWKKGLGTLEVITDREVVPLEIQHIYDPVGEMIADSVKFIFSQESRT